MVVILSVAAPQAEWRVAEMVAATAAEWIVASAKMLEAKVEAVCRSSEHNQHS
jgi:hypothetical protein